MPSVFLHRPETWTRTTTWGLPIALNSAVDSMLKKEFDALRKNGGSHPLLDQFGADAKPASHDMIDEWR